MRFDGAARYEKSMSEESSSLSGWWSRLLPTRGDEPRGRDDIVEFLAACRDQKLLAGDEHTMLKGVLEVSETQVRDIMVPRSHMVVLDLDDSRETLLKTIIDSGHSRFPVIGEDRDQVVGILLAKDLLRRFGEQTDSEQVVIADLLRAPVFIPESKRLNALLTQFRESRNHMAIVVDEYGGVAGLATIEDVIEQIVGDIGDEHDPEDAEQIVDLGNERFNVLALTRVEVFNEHFSVAINDEEYDTIGGLVMHELGRLPRRGELLEFGGFRFKVLRADRRRIYAVEVSRIASSAG